MHSGRAKLWRLSTTEFNAAQFVAQIETHTGKTLSTTLGVDKIGRNCHGALFF
jgi:hypothetical protein